MEKKYPFISFIAEHLKLNIYIAVIYSIFLLILVFLIIPLEYTATVSVLPSAANFSQGIMGKLGGLSKIAGLNFGTGQTAQSQEMYMGIINSRRLLEQVIRDEYQIKNEEESVTINLIEFFEIDDEDEREIDEKALKKMREDVVSVIIDPENDILYLNVTTENPFLSAILADKIVAILDTIVMTEVQKEVRQQLHYLEGRLGEIEDSLKIAEKRLKIFLETNSDPTLPSFQVEQMRLKRGLQLQTELYIEFRKQLEIFLAENVANLTDIKILDQAYPPYKKSRPKRILLLIAFGLLCLFVQTGVNASILIVRNFKQEFTGNLLEKTKRET